jgi:hypothetical protein
VELNLGILEFRVQNVGFRVKGSGLGLGVRDLGFGCTSYILHFVGVFRLHG